MPQTLLEWVKRAQVGAGALPGASAADLQRINQLERENQKLRRVNEILRTASAFFAQTELDRKLKS
jgi:transposase